MKNITDPKPKGELGDESLEDNDNGPTGHGPDICESDADPGL